MITFSAQERQLVITIPTTSHSPEDGNVVSAGFPILSPGVLATACVVEYIDFPHGQ